MRKKWTRCALKLYRLRSAPTTTAGIPSRHDAADSKFPAAVRTHRALALLAQRAVEATSDRRHKGHPRFRRRFMLEREIALQEEHSVTLPNGEVEPRLRRRKLAAHRPGFRDHPGRDLAIRIYGRPPQLRG